VSYADKDGFRLHEYKVRPRDGLIVGPDGQRPLPRAAMDVLLYLAEHAGEVVDPDTLLRVADIDDLQDPVVLANCIRNLRNHLADDGESPRFIQKVAERGYRLVAPVILSNDIVAEAESEQVRVQPMDGDHEGDYLLETSNGPVVLQPIADEKNQALITEGGWFAELKRRRVFRAVGAYAVVAWLLLQIVDVLSGMLPVPDRMLPLSAAVLGLGFPVVALLAWVYQWTPQGLILDLDKSQSRRVDPFKLTHYLDLVIIGALLIVVAFFSFGRYFPQAPTDAEITIAVLPFSTLGNEESDGYLSQGIADDIRSRLYGVPQFLIAARASSRFLFDQGFGIAEIGERLGVSHIIEGSVQHDGDRIHVNVQLVDVASGFSRWIETYDTRLDNVLDVQNNISLAVASELEILLTRDVRRVLAHDPTDDSDAYIFYLQGRAYLDRPRNVENMDHAESLFDRAIELDPGFALAYARLCQTKIGQYHLTRDTAIFAMARGDCQQALALDSSLAGVHTALGELYLSEGRFDEAERAYQNAIDLDPRAVAAWSGLGNVYSAQKKNVAAEEQYEQAIARQPGNWVGYDRLGRHFLVQGRYRESIENYQRVIDLSPDNSAAYNNLGINYFFLGNFSEAANYYRQSLAIDPRRSAFSNTGTMLYYAGDFAEAAEMFRTATELAPTDYRLWGNRADAVRFLENGSLESARAYRQAIDLATEQLSVNPVDGDTLSNLAWYYANLDDIDEANRYLSSAEEVASEFAEQLFIIGITYQLLGDKEKARQALEESLSLGFPQVILDGTPELKKPATQ